MYHIKIYNTIHNSGLQLFPTENYSIGEDMDTPDAIICRSANLHEIKFPNSLKAIARAGTGVNNIPVDTCTEKGIVVFNTMGANANAVKELVFGGMVIGARNLGKAIHWINELDSSMPDLDAFTEKNKKLFSGFELKNKTLGVIGLGAIGHQVANLGAGLGMDIVGYDPFLSIDNALKLSRQITLVKNIDDIMSQSDFITIHVGYSDATHHLIRKDNLKFAKQSTIILNFARKLIVDEEAIIEQLDADKLGLYISDFPSEENINHPKILSFPHLGASTKESEENCATLAVTAIRKFLETGEIRGSVNFPDCALYATEGSMYRLLIGNKNVANIVGQITQFLGSNSINIQDMINTHKHEIAYNIIDVEQEINEEIIDKIKAIDGVYFIHQIKL